MPGTHRGTDPTAPDGAEPDGPAAAAHPVTRRLAVGAGLAATAGLAAGCAIGGSGDPAVPPSGPAGGSGSGSRTGSGSGSGPEAAEVIIAVDQVPIGGAVAVTIDGRPAVVARPDEQAVAAFSARCTHMGCTVAVAEDRLQCPCHGSQFDMLTGAVLRGPAAQPLPEIPVRLDDGNVQPS